MAAGSRCRIQKRIAWEDTKYSFPFIVISYIFHSPAHLSPWSSRPATAPFFQAPCFCLNLCIYEYYNNLFHLVFSNHLLSWVGHRRVWHSTVPPLTDLDLPGWSKSAVVIEFELGPLKGPPLYRIKLCALYPRFVEHPYCLPLFLAQAPPARPCARLIGDFYFSTSSSVSHLALLSSSVNLVAIVHI